MYPKNPLNSCPIAPLSLSNGFGVPLLSILNPKTGRYVNYNGVLGKKIRKEMKGGSSEYPGNSLSGRGMPYQRTDFPYKVGTNLDEKYLF